MQLISYYGLQTNFSPFLDSATRFWFVSFKEYDPKLWVEGIASSSLLIFSPHCFPPSCTWYLGFDVAQSLTLSLFSDGLVEIGV